jgi:hypothetical protein
MARRKAPTTVPIVADAPKNPSFCLEDRRLSLKKCRGLVGSSCQLSDEQLKEARDLMYALADLLIGEYVKGKSSDYRTAPGLGNQQADVDSIPTVM